MKSKIMNTFTVGFAVFAMLFGAGNLIFPPYLGMHAGKNWIYGFIGFALMDVIFTMIVMIVISKKKDGVEGIVGILGTKLSKILMLALYICIGPLVAIPRTAATTFELSITPLIPGMNSVVFSIVFFTVILLLCIKPSKIIDIVGTVLAPLLLITLGVLIIKGVISPLGGIVAKDALNETVKVGITTGYQTMDTMAALAFAILIINQVKAYKLDDRKKEQGMVRNACIIAAVALILVYGGLAYLGATVSGSYSNVLSRSEIILKLAEDILGSAGLVVLAIIVAAACMTTAIGLVSSSASYMEELTNKKVSYKVFAIIICVFSAVTCNVGLDNIIALASPILSMMYPILLTLIILAMIKDELLAKSGRYGAVIGTTLFVCLQFVEDLTKISHITTEMPLASLGFAWMIPALVGATIGVVVNKAVLGYKNQDVEYEK